MLNRLAELFSASPEQAGYQAIPAEEPIQDNTGLYNQIPVDVLALIASRLSKEDLIAFALVNKRNYRTHEQYFDNTKLFNKLTIEHFSAIASFLPRESLIPFFLTNRNTLHAFEDFNGNAKQGALRVLMPTHKHSVYHGKDIEVNFSDVNHVLMAQYRLRIKMDELEANQAELQQEDDQRNCLATAAIISIGVGVGIAAHVGTAILLDKVILPGCFQCCTSGFPGNCCLFGGNVCQTTDPVVCGTFYNASGEVINQTCPLGAYRYFNISTCYVLAPCIASVPAGAGMGCLVEGCCPCTVPSNYTGGPLRRCIVGETYHDKHRNLDGEIRLLDSSRNVDFENIIALNDQLREKKIGGASYRMFERPVELRMEDEPARQENSNDAPQRLGME